jgi:hypothetical protein
MTCIFVSLACTCVLAYTWRLSPLNTIIFSLGCDNGYVILMDKSDHEIDILLGLLSLLPYLLATLIIIHR